MPPLNASASPAIAGASLSVIVPLYQEERRVEGSVKVLLEGLVTGARDELILVDDGSTDGTPRLVNELTRQDPRIRARQSEVNRGKGHALRMGMEASRGELVLLVDADLSASLAHYPRLLAAIDEGADIAIGSRAVAGAEVPVPQPLHRVVSGRIGNILLRAASPSLRGFKDTQCGFKLMRGDVARFLAQYLTIERWGVDFELMHVAVRHRYRVTEVPISWSDSDSTRVGRLDHFRTLADLARLMVNDARGRYGRPPSSGSRAAGP